MKYDGAEYFFLNFEGDELENEAGGSHIGMFLAWANFDKLAPVLDRRFAQWWQVLPTAVDKS